MATASLPRRDFLKKAGLVTGAIAAGPAVDSFTPTVDMPTIDVPQLLAMDAMTLARAIKTKQVSCRTVMEGFLTHIDRINPKVNAIVSLQDRDTLLKQADQRDAQLACGEYLGWLHGFPQAIKDLTATKGIPTTQGSPLLRNFIPQTDAFVVERIKKSGAIIIGKTNTPEFGLGSQTYNNVFGTTLNAYDQKKTAGGSSGGAAVSVALHMQVESIGCKVEEAQPYYPPEMRWASFITLRHWLTAGSLCHFYNDPAQREQLKPEAQWEVEVGLQLSAMDIYRASVGRSEVYQAADRLFKEYDDLLLPASQVFPFAADVHWPQEIDGSMLALTLISGEHFSQRSNNKSTIELK